jgi:mono/diheme cytochrome c family protein
MKQAANSGSSRWTARAWSAYIASLPVVPALSLWELAHSGALPQQLHPHGGKAIYEAACAACHGVKGDGAEVVLATGISNVAWARVSPVSDSSPPTIDCCTAVPRIG